MKHVQELSKGLPKKATTPECQECVADMREKGKDDDYQVGLICQYKGAC